MRKRLSLVAASALVIGAAACSSKAPTADPSLAADLKAAVNSGNPGQVFVSALEGGPQSAPRKAAPKPVYKPTPRAETRVASTPEPAPAPTPAPPPVVQQPAPQPTPVEAAPAPVNRPQPVQQQRQQGTYKTEAEIFRQMPWIRP
ncbi:MAG TPA: hypothetical protein VGM50_11400 [Gemmatimonadaceae bacterium]